jgi:hypothetical protein
MRKTCTVFGVVVAFAGLASHARAEIDVEVPPVVAAKSTLSVGETENFRFHAESGALLTVTATAAKKTNLAFALELHDGADAVVIVPAAVITDLGKKITWKNFVVPATDDYRLQVSGTGSGAYALSLTVKPQRKWTTTLSFADAGPLAFAFSAPKGSTVLVSAKTAKASAAAPSLVSVTGPLGYSQDLSTAGKKTTTSHAASLGVLPVGGDFTLSVGDAGAPGDVAVAVVVIPPHVKPGKFDLRNVKLGRPAGGETLVARTVDAAGGTVSTDDPAGDLNGASVTIPAGALTKPLLISVSSTVTPPLASEDDQAAGPAVDLEPSGTIFTTPATVTLPYDLSQLPADATPSDIRIRIVEADGSATEVAPDNVDTSTGIITAKTIGFSTCVPVVRRGTPRLGVAAGGDEFWFCGLSAQMGTDYGQNDSRDRQMRLEEGVVSFFGDNTFQTSSQKTTLQWSNSSTSQGQGPIDGTVTSTVAPDSFSANWAYGADGQTIQVLVQDSGAPVFMMSRDGNVMSSRPVDSSNPQAENVFCFRKPAQTPTLDAAAGTYQGVGFEFHADSQGVGSPAGLSFRRIFASMTVTSDGGASISFTQRKSSYDQSTGQWSSTLENGSLVNGAVTVESQGTLLATFPDQNGESVDPLRIYPGRNFNGGFFTNGTPRDGKFLLVLFARTGSGLGVSDVDGTWRGGIFDPTVNSYDVPANPTSIHVPDFNVSAEGTTGTFDGTSAGSLAFHDHKVQRDNSVAGGVQVQEKNDSTSVTVSVTSKGKLTFATPEGAAVGALAPDGTFAVLGTDVSNAAQTDYFIGVVVRSPPSK